MMKKLNLLLCAAALCAAGMFAFSTFAQKSADAPTDARQTQHDAQGHDMKTHADCPMRSGTDVKDTAAQTDDAKHTDEAGHTAHLSEVNARGEAAMGFSQTETTHHFQLTGDGGVIRVEVNDPNDQRNRESIRQHLAHVARMFAEGNFDTPALVHARTPPGAETLARLKADIVYTYEETERGGLVRISAKTPQALAAVHQFLRFQIEDHQTGDPRQPVDSRQ
ncbi:MAG TPA: hypothetical protein VJ866_10185 [Pyrinomonadaceae bacterium]|nr:hypothetical protein [Pyrinomonadaceae bacterium]